MIRLFLVRHAETSANVDMRYLGDRDDPLDVRGSAQAEQLAEALAELPIHAVYTSPSRRAADTAAPIALALGLKARADWRLREAAFGDWEGLTRAQVITRSQEDAALLESWLRDPSVAPPNGEPLVHVRERVVQFVRDAAAREAGHWIAVVTHVSPIKALIAQALDIPLQATRRFFLDPATITVLDWGEVPVLRLFNAHEHLGWKSARWMVKGRSMTTTSPKE